MIMPAANTGSMYGLASQRRDQGFQLLMSALAAKAQRPEILRQALTRFAQQRMADKARKAASGGGGLGGKIGGGAGMGIGAGIGAVLGGPVGALAGASIGGMGGSTVGSLFDPAPVSPAQFGAMTDQYMGNPWIQNSGGTMSPAEFYQGVNQGGPYQGLGALGPNGRLDEFGQMQF